MKNDEEWKEKERENFSISGNILKHVAYLLILTNNKT